MKRRAAPSPEGLVLAMDIGTSSLRTALFSLDGARLAETTSQQTYSLRTDVHGAAELSPVHLVKAAIQALAITLQRQNSNSRLRAVPVLGWGISCFWHSLAGADERYAPLTPVYTWGDSRCSSDAAKLRVEFSEKTVHARTGCMLRSSYWPAKFAWLRRTQPALFRRVKHWLSPADLVCARLCGKPLESFSVASGTGLLDLRRNRWYAPLAEHLRFDPEPVSTTGTADPLRLSGSFARRFPALRDTPLFPAIGDGAASNLGSGAVYPGVAAINYGTSAAARVLHSGPYKPVPFGLFCYGLEPGRWLIGGATSNAGNAHHWASGIFQGGDDARSLEAEYRKHQRPDASLIALASLHAERAPSWREEVPGVIFGLRQSHTAFDVQRAFDEATFLRLAQIVEPLERATGVKKLKFIVSGGLSASRPAVQRLTDALNRACSLSGEPEASLRGAAAYALEKLGRKVPSPSNSQSIRPRAAMAKNYEQARASQAALETALADFAKAWART